jgi:NAD(P)-dependent dehydrogenase (short-subunit alcohol dehydrogenase family)
MSSRAESACPKIAGLKTLEQLNNPFPSYQTSTSFLGRCARYAYTKACNELFKIELQRRLDAEGSSIVVLSVHPGVVKTENCMESIPWYFRYILMSGAVHSNTGATSAVFAASDLRVRKELRAYKAAYLDSDTTIRKASAQGRDMKLAGDLWSLTTHVVDKILTGKM